MEQFTAIRGRKIPKAPYNSGDSFSTNISTNCVMDAMVAMNIIKARKLKSTLAKDGLIQARDPSLRTLLRSNQFSGTVITITNITATPSPKAVLTFLETAK